ncbi:MAG TPA: biopolymer transporter ExbD [Chitinophagaceae bacterium]|nr:biopolymer transporter ExbD [Chitinophagaceae bacterium]
MTTINPAPAIKNKRGTTRPKKTSGAGMRIDMTPMVDLGFLLIAFFILTTEMSRPAVTKLYMPREDIITKIPESKSITILLGSPNQIFYYFGTEGMAIKNNRIFRTSYDESSGLGNVIRQKQKQLEKSHIDSKQLIVLIKPGVESSYKDLVAAMDEMLINAVTRYAILDQEDEEVAFVKRQH